MDYIIKSDVEEFIDALGSAFDQWD